MHLELLEYMTDTFRTNHPTVSPDQQKLLALQVLAGVQQFIKDLKTMFKGRYPNATRQNLQAVLAVAASKCTDRIRVKYYGDKTKHPGIVASAWTTTGSLPSPRKRMKQ